MSPFQLQRDQDGALKVSCRSRQYICSHEVMPPVLVKTVITQHLIGLDVNLTNYFDTLRNYCTILTL
ncbi:hypothetical protein BD560DRAFT_431607 [Blakeslea trispora]|nr:hypothetical protein BD560DRAFT_431607 [Blakeslea trispora]